MELHSDGVCGGDEKLSNGGKIWVLDGVTVLIVPGPVSAIESD